MNKVRQVYLDEETGNYYNSIEELENARKTKTIFEMLIRAVKDDDDYAWGWHCNIAVPFQDEGGTHEQANRAAARIMYNIFGVDVTTFYEWKLFVWAKNE